MDGTEELPAVLPVASLQIVLAALADPVRLEMVRRLVAADDAVQCSHLYDEIGKSTASHHFKILREAGVTERRSVAGLAHQKLRDHELESTYPGLLTSIVSALGNRASP